MPNEPKKPSQRTNPLNKHHFTLFLLLWIRDFWTVGINGWLIQLPIKKIAQIRAIFYQKITNRNAKTG